MLLLMCPCCPTATRQITPSLSMLVAVLERVLEFMSDRVKAVPAQALGAEEILLNGRAVSQAREDNFVRPGI